MNSCTICGKEMPIRGGRGRQLKTCSESCKAEQAKRLLDAKKLRFNPCSVKGCDNLANRTGLGLCEVHYYRRRRNGTTELGIIGNPDDVEHSHGYLLRRAKGHPMAVGGSRAYVHRMVYYDVHGAGPFSCKWCGKEVTWSNLHIDHLDDNKKNNDVSNLAATCFRCNAGRSMEKKKLNLAMKQGIEFNGEIRTLNSWAEKLGISRPSLVWRFKRGWSVERALTEGRGKFGPKLSE